VENVFYEYLAEELIDNEYDSTVTRRRQSQGVAARSPDAVGRDGLPKSGIGVYLTPTKKKRKSRNGTPTNQLAQSRCKICLVKTSHVCNGCLEMDPDEKYVFICHSRSGRDCFAKHKALDHNVERAL
jgi:hypothetical protein